MPPTVPLLIPLHLLVGLLFAAAAGDSFREGHSPFGRQLLAVLSFQLIVGWPLAAYFAVVHADWSWMYLADPATLPRFALPLALGFDLLALLSGWFGGWLLLRAGKTRALALTTLTIALGILVADVALRGRVFRDATLEGFERGESLPMYRTRLLWVVLVACTGFALAAASAAKTIASEGRAHARPSPPPSQAASEQPPSQTIEPPPAEPPSA
jgi:hypothetical protein